MKIITKRCPYDGVKFSDIPGYDEGYGCPVCKGLTYHLDISEEEHDDYGICDKCLNEDVGCTGCVHATPGATDDNWDRKPVMKIDGVLV